MINKDVNQQSWIEKSNAIIDSIADEFDCVCYVDLAKNLDEDDVDIFHASQFLVARVPALRGERNLRKRLSSFAIISFALKIVMIFVNEPVAK